MPLADHFTSNKAKLCYSAKLLTGKLRPPKGIAGKTSLCGLDANEDMSVKSNRVLELGDGI